MLPIVVGANERGPQRIDALTCLLMHFLEVLLLVNANRLSLHQLLHSTSVIVCHRDLPLIVWDQLDLGVQTWRFRIDYPF